MATATQTAPPPSIAHRVVNDEPISVEEYLRRERERKTGERFEYVDGWVLAMHAVRSDEEIDTMTGPTLAHNIAVSNVSGGLRERLRNDECRAVAPSPRVAIPALDAHLYPDLLILCESPEIENDHRDTITNPQVIVEVLSPSTMDYDRGEKFARYRQIDALQEYLLVAQDQPHVEHYVQQDDASWRFTETDGLDASITLPSVEAELPLSEVYIDVFDDEASSQATDT
jgi:Uma2 family endonuclease